MQVGKWKLSEVATLVLSFVFVNINSVMTERGVSCHPLVQSLFSGGDSSCGALWETTEGLEFFTAGDLNLGM